MIRMLLKDYNPVRISEMIVMNQFHFFLPDFLNFQNSFEVVVKLLNESIIRYIFFRMARDTDNIFREIADSEFEF
jgi:hypothetical protein